MRQVEKIQSTYREVHQFRLCGMEGFEATLESIQRFIGLGAIARLRVVDTARRIVMVLRTGAYYVGV